MASTASSTRPATARWRASPCGHRPVGGRHESTAVRASSNRPTAAVATARRYRAALPGRHRPAPRPAGRANRRPQPNYPRQPALDRDQREEVPYSSQNGWVTSSAPPARRTRPRSGPAGPARRAGSGPSRRCRRRALPLVGGREVHERVHRVQCGQPAPRPRLDDAAEQWGWCAAPVRDDLVGANDFALPHQRLRHRDERIEAARGVGPIGRPAQSLVHVTRLGRRADQVRRRRAERGGDLAGQQAQVRDGQDVQRRRGRSVERDRTSSRAWPRSPRRRSWRRTQSG